MKTHKKATYLDSICQVGTESVACRHGIWESLGALKVGVDQLEAPDTGFHHRISRENLQIGHIFLKLAERNLSVSVSSRKELQCLLHFTYHPISLSVSRIMLSTSSIFSLCFSEKF